MYDMTRPILLPKRFLHEKISLNDIAWRRKGYNIPSNRKLALKLNLAPSASCVSLWFQLPSICATFGYAFSGSLSCPPNALGQIHGQT